MTSKKKKSKGWGTKRVYASENRPFTKGYKPSKEQKERYYKLVAKSYKKLKSVIGKNAPHLL